MRDNMLALVRPGGFLLVVAPCVWEPHAWPSDFYRLLPDFFTKYAETRGLSVVEDSLYLSARDTRRFSDDIEKFPEEAPARAGGVPRPQVEAPRAWLYNSGTDYEIQSDFEGSTHHNLL